jgi:hypothetical protein
MVETIAFGRTVALSSSDLHAPLDPAQIGDSLTIGIVTQARQWQLATPRTAFLLTPVIADVVKVRELALAE